MIFALILMLAAAPAGAQPASLRNLSQPGLRIPRSRRRSLRRSWVSFFIINVDGFDWSGPLALAPAFVELVTRLQIGGVIPTTRASTTSDQAHQQARFPRSPRRRS